MAVITSTAQKYGAAANTTDMGLSNDSLLVARGVIDIAKEVADAIAAGTTFTAGSQIDLISLELGTTILHFDAVIVEALSLGANNAIDIGFTTADPDEYVDAQTTTAVGRFGSYVSVTRPELLVADSTITVEVNGDTIATGKIAWSCVAVAPAKGAREMDKPKVYTHR